MGIDLKGNTFRVSMAQSASDKAPQGPIFLHGSHTFSCMPLNFLLKYLQDGTIYHPHSDMCVTAYRTPEGRSNTQIKRCTPGDKNQQWKFE